MHCVLCHFLRGTACIWTGQGSRSLGWAQERPLAGGERNFTALGFAVPGWTGLVQSDGSGAFPCPELQLMPSRAQNPSADVIAFPGIRGGLLPKSSTRLLPERMPVPRGLRGDAPGQPPHSAPRDPAPAHRSASSAPRCRLSSEIMLLKSGNPTWCGAGCGITLSPAAAWAQGGGGGCCAAPGQPCPVPSPFASFVLSLALFFH